MSTLKLLAPILAFHSANAYLWMSPSWPTSRYDTWSYELEYPSSRVQVIKARAHLPLSDALHQSSLLCDSCVLTVRAVAVLDRDRRHVLDEDPPARPRANHGERRARLRWHED